MNQKGWIAPLVTIVILLLGVLVGLQLIRQTNIFKSKASNEVITYAGANVHAEADGTLYISSNDVTIDLLSPFGPPQSRVLGVSTQNSSFWDDFINTFLVSLHLKKAPPEKTIDQTIDPASLPVAKKLTPSVALNPASRATFPTEKPLTQPTYSNFMPVAPARTVISTPQPSIIPTPIPTHYPSPSPTPSPSASSVTNATLGFRVSESPTEIETKEFLLYSFHPHHLHYVFSTSTEGVKTIFVQFKSARGELSSVFAKSIELRLVASASASVSAIVSPIASSSASSAVSSH